MLKQTLLACLAGAVLQACAGPEARRVREVLTLDRHERGAPWERDARDLTLLGDRALPLLAHYLRDPRLGHRAARTMLVIDENRAAPMILGAFPNVPDDLIFGVFLHVFEKQDAGIRVTVPYAHELHDAAVRCLNARIMIPYALEMIGATGDANDFPMLERYLDVDWLHSVGALTQLRSKKHLDLLMEKLTAPLPTPFTADEARMLAEAIVIAGYLRDRRFVEPVCRHAGDPEVAESGLVLQPAGAVPVALARIIDGTPTDAGINRDWNSWCGEKGYPVR